MPSTDHSELGITLADPAVLGDPESLRKRAEAEKKQERPRRTEPGQPGRYDGADETGAVWLSVDPEGRLTSVEISTSWRQRLGPERFADALFSAYRAAVRHAIDASRTARQDEPVFPTIPTVDPDADFPAWLVQSRAQLAALKEQMAAVSKANTRARERLADAREVRSPNGYLTLQLRAGVLTGITGAVAGLKSVNPNMLRQDVLEVFESANLAASR